LSSLRRGNGGRRGAGRAPLWRPVVRGEDIQQLASNSSGMGGCGGQISLGSTRRLEGLAKDFGPITSQGHPFVGQGRNHWQNG
jgi:hypothetical protein